MTTNNRVKFETFVSSLYDAASLPPLRVVNDELAVHGHYTRTGAIAVVAEDESKPCVDFSNWSNEYEFKAWVEYRRMTHAHKAFQAMVCDVLDHNEWSRETSTMIGAVHARMKAQTN